MKKYTLILVALFFPLLMTAQDSTAVKKHMPAPKPYHWNVIKFNPTPMLLWSNVSNITFSYERLVTRNQSFSVQAGYLLFPKLINDTVAHLVILNTKEKYGINLAVDYRYYPASRNRRPAPDGLYLGGYLSYYGYHFANKMDILYTTVDQNTELKGDMNIVNLGLELGYQFIFWKRMSLDLLLFGPSFSYYSARLSFSGALDEEQIKILDQEMVDRLLARFPALKSMFSGESLQFTGSRARFNIGFRYALQIGVHF